MSPKSRRKSIDSSDSSSSSSSSDSDGSKKKYKPKKEKKDKKHKKDKKVKDGSHAAHYTAAGHSAGLNHAQMPLMPNFFSGNNQHQAPSFPSPSMASHHSSQGPAPPASGYRIPLTASATLPPPDQMGPAPCVDLDGRSPVYIGSALFDKSVHPCKIGPHLKPPCSVAYGGGEIAHHGRYDLLPFDPNTMEFVPTSDGKIPSGRRPVEGG